MAEANTLAAENLLAQMLAGIPHRGGDEEMTVALNEIRTVGDGVETILEFPSGDTYRVRIEWLRERSP